MSITNSKPVTAVFPAVLLLLLACPVLLTNSDMYCRVMTMAFLYGALACGWNVYALTGSISLGHAAFFGLGAYGSALLSHYAHLSPYLTIPFGGMTGALYGAAWNTGFKKLRGAGLALATLAAVEIPKVIIDNWEGLTFGSLGLVGISGLPSLRFGGIAIDVEGSVKSQYYLLLCFVCVFGLLHRQVINSRWGWAVRATREDEAAASMLGIDTAATRSRALVLSAFLTGLCGGVYAHLIGLIEPALVFSLHISALPLVLTLFGGRYQFYGPLLGALILYPLDQLLLHSLVPVGHAIIYGLVIVLVMLFFPQGIGTWLHRHVKSA